MSLVSSSHLRQWWSPGKRSDCIEQVFQLVLLAVVIDVADWGCTCWLMDQSGGPCDLSPTVFLQKFCEDRVIVWYINVLDIITIRSFLFRCATTWSQRLRWKENSENQPDWVYGSARSGDCHWYPQNRSEAATDRRLMTKSNWKDLRRPSSLEFHSEHDFIPLTSTSQARANSPSTNQCSVCKLGPSGLVRPLISCATCHRHWHSYCHNPPISFSSRRNQYV